MDKLITIELSRSEKDLLLNDLPIDPDVAKKLALLAHRGSSLAVKVTEAQMRSLIACLDEEADRTADTNLQKAYRDLSAKMERLENGKK